MSAKWGWLGWSSLGPKNGMEGKDQGYRQQLWQEWREPAVTQLCSSSSRDAKTGAGGTITLPLVPQAEVLSQCPRKWGQLWGARVSECPVFPGPEAYKEVQALWGSCCPDVMFTLPEAPWLLVTRHPKSLGTEG